MRAETRAFDIESQPESDLARAILRIVYTKRRLTEHSCSDSHHDVGCETCFALHQGTVLRHVQRGIPLRMVLPAFPAKSPNPRKVLGPLPDMAEQLALSYLEGICERIKLIYPPGAVLTICSDGRVFSDLVGVSDRDVSQYAFKLQAMLRRIGARSIDVLGLEDVFDDDDFDHVRTVLVERYGQPLDALRRSIKSSHSELALFNGIARFLFEDALDLNPGESRNAIRARCKDRAYRVIQRSHAWSNLIAARYPHALRLSIHPYPAHSKKIGIFLLDAADNWLTPWHGVALRIGDRFTLTKRKHAEELQARLVHDEEGRPHYFSMEA